MKKLSLAIIFSCCTLAVAAQENIRVNYQGSRPTITNFVQSYLSSLLDRDDIEECDLEGLGVYKGLRRAMTNQAKGLPLEKGETLTIDQKNGYVLYEQKYEDVVVRVEMCYWNESDGKHKLFADNRWTFQNGKPVMGQFDGLSFYRYDNATKLMDRCNTPGFDVEYFNKAYALPRMGKDIIVTTWNDNGGKTQKTLKWNGHRFSY